jgi:hypothetical protein
LACIRSIIAPCCMSAGSSFSASVLSRLIWRIPVLWGPPPGRQAGRPCELKDAAEPCAHHTVELWCRSRLPAACQAKAAGFGPVGLAAAARCDGGAGATREQGLQAPAVGLGRGGEIRCRRSRAVRTPHRRAVVPVTAARCMPGQGCGVWTGGLAAAAARCGAAALPASRVCRRRL